MSISNSRLPRAFLIAALALAGFEALLRAGSGTAVLLGARDSFDVQHARRQQRLRRARSLPGRRVLLVGASDLVLATHELNERLSRSATPAVSALPLGLDGRGVCLQALADAGRIEAAAPALVVLGVSLSEFYGQAGLEDKIPYLVEPGNVLELASLPLGVDPAAKRNLLLRGLAGHFLRLYRYRGAYARVLLGKPTPAPGRRDAGPFELPLAPSADTPFAQDSLRRFVARMERARIPLLILDMPRETDAAASEMAALRAEHDRFLSSLRLGPGARLVRRAQVPVTRADMADHSHFKPEAARRFAEDFLAPLVLESLPP